MPQLDLNDIPIFVIVSQAGTFSAAAKKLGLPTSTVSRSVTRLEQSIGAMLFERSPKGLALTDEGREYLVTCKKALRSLRDGRDLLEKHREDPGGLLRIACPLTFARDVLAPVLNHFVEAYPSLRVEFELYASGWDEEPREDVDILFRLKAPKDSTRRIRCYPSILCGLFASRRYSAQHGIPEGPLSLAQHRCIGSGRWKFTKANRVISPEISFHVITSDPSVHLELVCNDVGIATLPLWMARQPHIAKLIVQVIPEWTPTSLSLCALYSGTTKLTPKVGAFLQFLGDYFGTDRDPRLGGHELKELFTDLHLTASGPKKGLNDKDAYPTPPKTRGLARGVRG